MIRKEKRYVSVMADALVCTTCGKSFTATLEGNEESQKHANEHVEILYAAPSGGDCWLEANMLQGGVCVIHRDGWSDVEWEGPGWYTPVDLSEDCTVLRKTAIHIRDLKSKISAMQEILAQCEALEARTKPVDTSSKPD